jgi:hypothetical protein
MKLKSKPSLRPSRLCCSVALENTGFANWGCANKAQRDTIEVQEWTLLNYSSDFITQAVGLTLDDAKGSLKNIQDATAQAKKAIETIKTVKKVIVMSGTVIKVAAAIVSANRGLIASATVDLINTIT